MPFPEALKVVIRKRAHLCCCLCHAIGVDVHHIVPSADGGLDEEDNAAPLCPSCHETYGANPLKRKFIREARDLWFGLCEKRYASDASQLAAMAEALGKLVTKDDLKRLTVENTTYVLGALSGAGTRADTGEQIYSFRQEEFIHPLIVRELIGWLSDPAETVIAVDLSVANRSNRFAGAFSLTQQDDRTFVKWTSDDRGSFMYAHIATSASGIQMVECYDCGSGSGVFGSVGLFSLEQDRALEKPGDAARTRILLKTLGNIVLGDRYNGKIVYHNGVLVIGPDEGWFQRGAVAAKAIPVL